MPNANYIKGRRKEYKIVKQHKDTGYTIAQRTAGSHSPFDVIAIDIENRVIKLIQAKPNNYTEKQTKDILEENKELNGPYKVYFVVE